MSGEVEDRRRDKTAPERHLQTVLVTLAVAAATASVALMLSLDKGFAVFSDRMERATIRLESVERTLHTLENVSYRLEKLEKEVDRYHQ